MVKFRDHPDAENGSKQQRIPADSLKIGNGRRARNINRLRWLCIVCVAIIFGRYDVLVFLQQFLWMASIDPIGVWGEYANLMMVWFLDVAHCVDGSRWSQSLLGNVLTTEFLWGAHAWRHPQSSGWFAAYPLSSLCRRWWYPSELFFFWKELFLQYPAYKWLRTYRYMV